MSSRCLCLIHRSKGVLLRSFSSKISFTRRLCRISALRRSVSAGVVLLLLCFGILSIDLEMSDTMALSGGIGAAASIVTFIFIYILKPFFTAANHKRVRSICCGKVCVTSLDVEDTTPTVVLRVMPAGVSSGVPSGVPSGVQSPRPLQPSPEAAT